jgi:hypothetical protein
MNKKTIFTVATVFFTVATVFNLNMLQTKRAGDVSLESITVMAMAQSETDSTGYETVKVYKREGRTIVDCRGTGDLECKA